MAKSVMCTKYDKWVHGGCAKMKRVTLTLAKDSICELCVDTMEGIVKVADKKYHFLTKLTL